MRICLPVICVGILITVWIDNWHHVEVVIVKNVSMTSSIFKELVHNVGDRGRADPFSLGPILNDVYIIFWILDPLPLSTLGPWGPPSLLMSFKLCPLHVSPHQSRLQAFLFLGLVFQF